MEVLVVARFCVQLSVVDDAEADVAVDVVYVVFYYDQADVGGSLLAFWLVVAGHSSIL